MTDRRTFVGGLAALAVGAAAPKTARAAGPLRRIDMHHHFLPRQYILDEEVRFGTGQHGNSFMEQWTPAAAIAACDNAGVDFAIASISTPGVWYGDVPLGRRLSRQWNEAAAQVVRDHPTRFGFFAPIPLPDTDGSLAEIDYAYATLHADGINLLSNYSGKWLGDPSFTPVMQELNRRKALVYVHPTFSPCCTNNMVPNVLAPTIEFPFDTARTIVSLVSSGTTVRFPDIRFIFSHGGGALFAVYGRLAGLNAAPAVRAAVPGGVFPELKKLSYDTAGTNAQTTLTALLDVIPPTQLLLGSDYPLAGPPPVDSMILDAVTAFEDYKPSPQLKAMVERDNAVRLVPRLARIERS
jgi:predicted TIM-barrel fold metal-dependent hydrolase